MDQATWPEAAHEITVGLSRALLIVLELRQDSWVLDRGIVLLVLCLVGACLSNDMIVGLGEVLLHLFTHGVVDWLPVLALELTLWKLLRFLGYAACIALAELRRDVSRLQQLMSVVGFYRIRQVESVILTQLIFGSCRHEAKAYLVSLAFA